jgi:hypothetical protein
MMSDGDLALIVDLKLAEDARLLFRELGFAIELWGALRLARTEHVTLTCETERLLKLRKKGRSPSLGGLIIDSIEQVWAQGKPPVAFYPASTWGPPEANTLLTRKDRTWDAMIDNSAQELTIDADY